MKNHLCEILKSEQFKALPVIPVNRPINGSTGNFIYLQTTNIRDYNSMKNTSVINNSISNKKKSLQ